MSGPQRTLSHIPFFEALASADEDSEAWRELTAGLVTLRLFDAWMTEGVAVVASDSWSLLSVREALSRVESRHSIRSLLSSVVDAMEAAPAPRAATVAPRLLAYGRALQFDGDWSLAADVFHSVIAYAYASEEPDVYAAANMHLGRCLRMTTDWSGALSAYRAAGDVAIMAGDTVTALRSRVGEASVARDRGNLPLAESLLDETIQEAQLAGLKDIRSTALHARAAVAHLRGQYELAVQLGYDALQESTGTDRDNILADLAASFFDLGARSVARDAYLVLAATAREQYTRWQSTINLIELAALDGSEPLFEQHRRELANASLPAYLAAYYHLYVGRGYKLFQQLETARAEMELALSIAAANQINQVIIEAELALREITDGGVVILSRQSSFELPSEIVPAAKAIREMRALAGVR
jgi:tetratricopeptide (TPR) repeat protein